MKKIGDQLKILHNRINRSKLPWKKLTIDSLNDFQIPFWNPYSFSGTPHLANYQSGTFSITNLFYFIFDFNIAWSFAVLVQPLLAGIFTYFFVRSLKKRSNCINYSFYFIHVLWIYYDMDELYYT